MFTGQIIDLYEFGGGLQATLWDPYKALKKTVTFLGLQSSVSMGDVVRIEAGVGSVATVLSRADLPEDFDLIIELPKRDVAVQLTLPAVATAAAD